MFATVRRSCATVARHGCLRSARPTAAASAPAATQGEAIGAAARTRPLSTSASTPGMSLASSSTARDALKKSCYYEIDFKVDQDATVFEAVQRFAAFNIGALMVTDNTGNLIGIISERDYVCKVALLGKQSQTTKVKEIATMGTNLVVAKRTDSVHTCMQKMLGRDIRHLPVVDDESGDVVGMMSIKDLTKEVLREKDEMMKKLQDFKLGKGGFYEHT